MFLCHRDDGLEVSDDPARLDLERICTWLASSYWAGDRDRATIERSIPGSRAYGVYEADGTQLALTRATTDGASFCWLGDVYVDAAARGRGIGTWLVGEVVAHLRSQGVPRFLLGTRDAHAMYAKLGFEPLRVPDIYMEIDLRAARPRPGDVRLPGAGDVRLPGAGDARSPGAGDARLPGAGDARLPGAGDAAEPNLSH